MKRALIAFLAVMMIAGGAFARGGGPGGGPGGRGPGDEGRGPGGGLLIADNGTVFVTRTVSDSATGTSSTEIKAISTSGATLWTVTVANRGHFTLSGSNLLTVSDASTTSAVASTITAISTATGATAWTLNVNGRVQGLEPYSGGTYAVVIVPAATEGGTATRSLVAISNSGTILWTAAL